MIEMLKQDLYKYKKQNHEMKSKLQKASEYIENE